MTLVKRGHNSQFENHCSREGTLTNKEQKPWWAAITPLGDLQQLSPLWAIPASVGKWNNRPELNLHGPFQLKSCNSRTCLLDVTNYDVSLSNYICSGVWCFGYKYASVCRLVYVCILAIWLQCLLFVDKQGMPRSFFRQDQMAVGYSKLTDSRHYGKTKNSRNLTRLFCCFFSYYYYRYYFSFSRQGSLCGPGCSWTHSVD